MATYYYTHKPARVNSSVIRDVAYDTRTNELTVWLTTSNLGAYIYNDVSFDTYKEFISSDSLGSYYNDHIKGKSYFRGLSTYKDTWVRVYETNSNVVNIAQGSPDTSGASRIGGQGSSMSTTYTLPLPPRRQHVVHFTVDGGNKVKNYTVRVGSVDEAVKALNDALAALDLQADITQVVVNFKEED